MANVEFAEVCAAVEQWKGPTLAASDLDDNDEHESALYKSGGPSLLARMICLYLTARTEWIHEELEITVIFFILTENKRPSLHVYAALRLYMNGGLEVKESCQDVADEARGVIGKECVHWAWVLHRVACG